jgi:hypothetical protein
MENFNFTKSFRLLSRWALVTACPVMMLIQSVARADVMSTEYSCFQAIDQFTGSTTQTDLSTMVDYNAVMFPGDYQVAKETTVQGLYVLLENSAYFYQFPYAPVAGKERIMN